MSQLDLNGGNCSLGLQLQRIWEKYFELGRGVHTPRTEHSCEELLIMRLRISKPTQISLLWALMIGLSMLSHAIAQEGEVTKRVKLLKQGDVPPAANLEQLEWIAGSWQGEGLGGNTEEVWSKPSKGSMMGMFKLIQNDKVVFYEMMTITPLGSSLVLRIKHFDDALRGWEDKDKSVEFPLVEVGESKAFFSGLTFEKKSKSELAVVVNIKDKESGKAEEVAFEFRRQESLVKARDTSADDLKVANGSRSSLPSKGPMNEARNMSFVATKDVVAAKQFYGEKLGFELLHEDNLAVMYRVGQNMVLRVQRMKEFTPQPFTVSGWQVDDLKSTVADLTKQGVTFEKYGFLKQDDLGIHVFDNGDEVAWLKDPDGNILSISKLE